MKDFLNEFDLGVSGVVLLGKGPSFDRYGGGGYVVGINQVIERRDLDIWIFSHAEIYEACRGSHHKARYVVAPYYPIYGGDGSQRCDKLVTDFFDRENLYCYNAPWQNIRVGSSKQVVGSGTTAHHAVHLLSMKGVKEFEFCGIDGGRKVYGKQYYSSSFNLDPKSYFESGISPINFDTMWATYFELRRKYDLRYTFV